MSSQDLTPELWYLIFQALPTRSDLRNVCAVSRSFGALATSVLYRSVILRKSMITGKSWSVLSSDMKNADKEDDMAFSLFNRLLDDQNERLRAIVRDLTVEDAGGTGRAEGQEWLEHPLTSLVKKIPNLENLYLYHEFLWPEGFTNAFCNHNRSPKLHLLGEQGRTQVRVIMPYVHTLRTSLRARSRVTGPKQQELDLKELFAAFPNLDSLSVLVNRRASGCRPGPLVSTTRLQPLTSSGSWTFPPLQSLSLSGYNFWDQTEISLWRERFPWERLQSLCLGPQDNKNFLEQFGSHLKFLKHFQNTANCNQTPSSHPELNLSISSFDGLESLMLKGYTPSLDAVTHHPNLKHLCLHAIEKPGQKRPTLSAKELEILDRSCPKLTTLEIDVNPESAWSDAFIYALAMGFERLRRLSIHIALGMLIHKTLEGRETMRAEFEAVLTDSKAQDFGARFFERRGPASVLEMLSLRTGEDLRHFSEWGFTPFYASLERRTERIFEIYPPREIGDEPFLKELPNRDARFRRRVERDFARVSGNRST